MERRPIPGLEGNNALRPAPDRLPGVRLGLGALTRPAAGWFGLCLVATGLAAGVFLHVTLRRWRNFETNAFDFAFFDQVLSNTSRGDWFATSFVPYNFAGQHLEPILLVYLPAYWLGAGPPVLLVSQALVAAGAAVPLFGLARRLSLSLPVSTALTVAYLSNPYLHRAIGFDFHPEVMVALPAFSAGWAIAAGRSRTALALTFSCLLFKEDAVFVVLVLAGFMWARGWRRPACATGAVAAAYALVAVFIVMPLVRGTHDSDLVERYGYFMPGGTGSGLAADLTWLPWRIAEVLFAPGQLLTAGLFLIASAPVAAARPWRLAWLLPGLGLALLSTHPEQRALELHYAAGLVPVALLLAARAASELPGSWPRTGIALALAAPPLAAAILLNPLGASVGTPPTDEHRAALHEALALVPGDAGITVSAQSGLLPRLTRRHGAFEFPREAGTADWIVVDRYGFRSTRSIASGYDEELARVRARATLVFARDGVEVFRRER